MTKKDPPRLFPVRPPPVEGSLHFGHRHLDVFRTGIPLVPQVKALLIHVWNNLRKTFANRSRVAVATEKGRAKLFSQLTGFSERRAYEYRDEYRKNHWWLLPAAQRGPKRVLLEEEIDDLAQWLDEVTQAAAKGTYLTLPMLVERFNDHFAPVFTNAFQLQRALKRLGFKYQPRVRSYLSAKFSDPVQQRLLEFCFWVCARVAYSDELGIWFFTEPTMFEDEAFLLSGDFCSWSWC